MELEECGMLVVYSVLGIITGIAIVIDDSLLLIIGASGIVAYSAYNEITRIIYNKLNKEKNNVG